MVSYCFSLLFFLFNTSFPAVTEVALKPIWFIAAVEAENQVELEEKTRLINQVLELQHTLEG